MENRLLSVQLDAELMGEIDDLVARSKRSEGILVSRTRMTRSDVARSALVRGLAELRRALDRAEALSERVDGDHG